ncbi:MAG: hypothetical protein IKB64_06995 [Paludibacteraceae bacterium]|nr:hypothetical protein [Paludibacteraceae bacterium]
MAGIQQTINQALTTAAVGAGAVSHMKQDMYKALGDFGQESAAQNRELDEVVDLQKQMDNPDLTDEYKNTLKQAQDKLIESTTLRGVRMQALKDRFKRLGGSERFVEKAKEGVRSDIRGRLMDKVNKEK